MEKEIEKIKGTCAECPSDAYLFDWTECNKCMLFDDCNNKENRDGCHFGVDNEEN